MSLAGGRGRSVTAAILAILLFDAPGARAAEVPAVTRHVLSNGMTVLVRESHAAGVVAASLQVDAGSGVESTEAAGITNFVHRVMARGTTRRSAGHLVEAAEELGGAIEALADVEYGEVRGHALARHWEALLALVAEVVLEPAFPPDEIERARRLILSQIQTRADTPLAFATDALLGDLYGPHPYGLPTAGRRESIAALSRKALVAHYRRVYRPERLVLAVSGAIPRARVLKQVERLFGKLPRRGVAEAPAASAPAPTRDRRVLERPAQQAQVLMGYLGPGLGATDYAAVKVLAALLGGGASGRLFRELRDRQGLAYSLGVLNPSRRGPSAFMSYMGTAPANVEAAEAAMGRELERVRTEPPSDDELTRAKAYVLGTLAMDRRTNARQAWYLAFFELVGAGWEFPDRYAKAVEAVTAADVLAAARRYLERPTTVVVIPRDR